MYDLKVLACSVIGGGFVGCFAYKINKPRCDNKK